MRPVVDIISDVVSAMKPVIDVNLISMTRGGAVEHIELSSKRDVLSIFVGERVKLTFAEGVYYCKVASIDTEALTFTVDLTTDGFATVPTAAEFVLNYHYGHLLDIKNKFMEWASNSGVKQEQFPAIVLVQDFQEKMDMKKHQRDATLRVIILTDSNHEFDAPNRYMYNIKPILYPLFDLFLDRLQSSKEVISYDQGFEKWDRLMWGRAEGQGTASSIFYDWIDAIEILNLNCKIINTC